MLLHQQCKEATPVSGKTECRNTGGASGASVLPQSPSCPWQLEPWQWEHSHPQHEGGAVMVGEPSLTLEWQDSGDRETLSGHRDRASKRRWGATTQGVQTGGPWSRLEFRMHINCLEALAAFLAIKSFVPDRRSMKILLRMDNMSAVTYENKLGGTVSQNLTALTKDLWLWCLQRDITLIAEQLLGIQNTIADEESHVMKNRTD